MKTRCCQECGGEGKVYFCPECKGLGDIDGKECSGCEGTGDVKKDTWLALESRTPTEEETDDCEECGGRGYVFIC